MIWNASLQRGAARRIVDQDVPGLRGPDRSSPGNGSLYRKAIELIDDDSRVFISSPYVRLEVLPKALFHRRFPEADFYRAYFEAVKVWIQPDQMLLGKAVRVAVQYGLSALDALHVTAALSAGADEIVTSEKPGRPIHRVSGLSVKSIHS